MVVQTLASAFGVLVSRTLGGMGWVAIIVLSVLPGSARPHSGASGVSEHFIVYGIVALCLCHGFSRTRHRVFSIAGLVASSAMLEIAQIYIPGRTAEIKGLLSSAAGCMVGLLLIQLLRPGKT